VEALVVRPGATPPFEYVPNHAEPVPGPQEVLIRVHLAGICATDLELARGYLNFSGIPGHEFVGTVIGGSPHLEGRRVVAEINCVCGSCDMCSRGLPRHCRRRTVLGIDGRDGAFAERVAVPQRNCHEVPAEITDEEAVFVEPLAAALQVVKLQPIDRWMEVAVVGSGRLGLLVAQVLKLQGCRLAVIGRNPVTLKFCERHGIQPIEVSELQPRPTRDVVVECTGSPEGLKLALKLCRPCGTIVLKSTYAQPAPLDLSPLVIHEIRLLGNRCGPFPEAIELLRQRKVEVRELVSRIYPLRQGLQALAAAERPENIKILLRPGAV
jgi:threonine dehydrogenase-like Zn-dependent dehydrogenase